MSEGVAVVIPAYNAAPWLPAALRSLQNQTEPPREVVVVDDGSSDATPTIAKEMGAKVIRQLQRGPGAARNRGVRESTSPLVAFLDADDWFAEQKLAVQARRLRELGVDAICSDAFLVDGDVQGAKKNGDRAVPASLTFDVLLAGNPVICSTVLCRREALVRVGLFDEDPRLIATEDYDLWLRLAREKPLAYLAEPLAGYRRHGVSLSANTRFLRGVDRILDKVELAGLANSRQRALVRRRRAGVRLDLAFDVLEGRQEGGHTEARRLIAEAQRLSFSWKGLRLWLKSRLPVGSR